MAASPLNASDLSLVAVALGCERLMATAIGCPVVAKSMKVLQDDFCERAEDERNREQQQDDGDA